ESEADEDESRCKRIPGADAGLCDVSLEAPEGSTVGGPDVSERGVGIERRRRAGRHAGCRSRYVLSQRRGGWCEKHETHAVLGGQRGRVKPALRDEVGGENSHLLVVVRDVGSGRQKR